MQTFKYKKSVRIIHWGTCFDSLLELKYALSIQDNFEFLRAHIPIFFDPKTKMPTNYLRENTRRYTPDFLIRHKFTGKATWVELKPRAFEGNGQLLLRKELAEKYIAWKKLDWSFAIVYDDEVILSAAQQEQFIDCCCLIKKSQRKLWFEKMNKQFDRSQPSFFKGMLSNRQVQFVMFGN